LIASLDVNSFDYANPLSKIRRAASSGTLSVVSTDSPTLKGIRVRFAHQNPVMRVIKVAGGDTYSFESATPFRLLFYSVTGQEAMKQLRERTIVDCPVELTEDRCLLF
jgi:hypothetical protein